MSIFELKKEMNKSVDLPIRVGDIIIVRSALAHVLNHSKLSDPARSRIKEIDKILHESYKNVDVGFLTIENIVIVRDY
ncbi:hypothetical protein LCGC14_2491900 [marine sediment metagenome]|uniref:Uncharacterized protein n=1 Tax=marine sediment metagenome TaxID=412755 RepID=A0A0F9B571_9ZZZZ